MKSTRNHTRMMKFTLYWGIGILTFLMVGIPSLSAIVPVVAQFKDIIVPCVATIFPFVAGMYGVSQWRAKSENVANTTKGE
jgi:hypothetical protein